MDQFFNTFLSTLKSTKDCDVALKMSGIVDTPEKKQAVETLKLTLKAKPKTWLPKLKISERGSCVLPAAVWLDADGGTTAIQALQDLLEEYKTNPAARPYSKS